MTYYDDIGEAYTWAVELPVAAVSLDFLGVPGSVLGSDTAALIDKHGFPSDKRLGAGVVDGRSVWADGESAPNLVAALIAKARPRPRRPAAPCPCGIQLPGCGAGWWNGAAGLGLRGPDRFGSAGCTVPVLGPSTGKRHGGRRRRAKPACQGQGRAFAEMHGRQPAADGARAAAQGVKHISVQSSVSLQHLPYNKELEQELPAEIVGRLAFAKQKLAEVVAAAKSAEGVKPVGLTSALPTVGAPPPPRMPPPRGRAGPLQL